MSRAGKMVVAAATTNVRSSAAIFCSGGSVSRRSTINCQPCHDFLCCLTSLQFRSATETRSQRTARTLRECDLTKLSSCPSRPRTGTKLIRRSSFVIAQTGRRYFAAFFSPWRAGASREGCLASARRSVFFRRFARFLALSLPRLCPMNVNFRPLVVP